jgi:transcriptional regulator with PAS, ATPase and Fis domain
LVEVLLHKLDQEYGRSVVRVSAQAMEVFRQYRWPGNVRELENVLGRAIMNMRYQDDEVRIEHLPLMAAAEASAPRGSSRPGDLPDGISLRASTGDAERRTIEQALEQAGHNKTKAARMLGISIRTLYNKLERFAN